MSILGIKKSKILIDDEDVKRIYEEKWHVNVWGKYPLLGKKNSVGKWEYVLMHRFILNCPKEKQVDHINHNTFDNRKINLRICSNVENHRNTKIHSNNKTGYKGVSWNKKSNKYESRIKVNKNKLHLGLFENKIEAARAYNYAAVKYFGEYALLNSFERSRS